MEVLYLYLKKDTFDQGYYSMICEYVESSSRHVRLRRAESIRGVPQNTSSIDLIVADHPTSNDTKILRELIQKDSNLKILITRFDFPQKKPEQDPDFERVYIVNKGELAEGILELLYST